MRTIRYQYVLSRRAVVECLDFKNLFILRLSQTTTRRKRRGAMNNQHNNYDMTLSPSAPNNQAEQS
jgi:hypothetical protein